MDNNTLEFWLISKNAAVMHEFLNTLPPVTHAWTTKNILLRRTKDVFPLHYTQSKMKLHTVIIQPQENTFKSRISIRGGETMF